MAVRAKRWLLVIVMTAAALLVLSLLAGIGVKLYGRYCYAQALSSLKERGFFLEPSEMGPPCPPEEENAALYLLGGGRVLVLSRQEQDTLEARIPAICIRTA
ncbi:hypothetical protein ACFLU6_08165 [Acidobacteriota bacterium]